MFTILNRMFQRLNPVAILSLTLLLLLPALWSGYMGDDLLHYALLLPEPPFPKPNDLSLFGLFSFINGDPERNQQLMNYSLIPWWTAADLKFAFWRPIAEFTHWLDQRWLQQPALMHAHSIAWYLLGLYLLFRIYSLLTGEKVLALIALALFAWDSSHGFAIGWISNRNALLALCFGLLTILAHHHWRSKANQPRSPTNTTTLQLASAVLSLVALTLCLLSAELGISVFGYLLAYALWLDKGSWWQRLLSLVPAVVVIGIWYGVYQWAGFGADAASAYYIDPATQPLTFILNALLRLPVLFASQWGLIPAEVYGFTPAAGLLYPGVCWVYVLLVLGVAFYVCRQQPWAAFFFTGSVFAAAPALSALPHDRLLLFVGIGSHGLLAGLLFKVIVRGWRPVARPWRYLVVTLTALLATIHLLIAPVLLPVMAYSPAIWDAQIPRGPAEMLPANMDPTATLILFGVPLGASIAITPRRFYDNRPLPARLWHLTSNNAEPVITVMGPGHYEVHVESGFIAPADTAFRDWQRQPLPVGSKVHLDGLTIAVTETDENGYPLTLELMLADPKSAPPVWLQWSKEQGYVPLQPTALTN